MNILYKVIVSESSIFFYVLYNHVTITYMTDITSYYIV